MIRTAGWIYLSPMWITSLSRSITTTKMRSFTDVSIRTGIDALTSRLSGWGMKFFDYDNDGNLDLLLCNGHPDTMVEKRMQDVRYREPMLLISKRRVGTLRM